MFMSSMFQAEALLRRMMAVDGNKSVAQDMATRQKIASFPPEIYDPDLLSKIKGLFLLKLFYR